MTVPDGAYRNLLNYFHFVYKRCYGRTGSINSSSIKFLCLPVPIEDILPAESTFLSLHLSDLPMFLNFAPSRFLSSVKILSNHGK